ncbi:hypothetical protein B0I33_105518 [Prauserella shujinwangii]|uniref:Uncharacterized protein n=1 Tax=Prauserella shujinwangii TaxID=1453103 RepID=A0A2T0LVT2_9PSEU|nr:hypothetical protein [Prauserella shujinwangii]PRX47934.1 hypothetical protein B0I33_105518 [Prauserella shujinwangii]
MADEKPTLVLHLTSGGEPVLFQLPPDATEENAQLVKRLHWMLDHGSVETIRTKDGYAVNVNFAHVAVAYVDDLQRRDRTFGLR